MAWGASSCLGLGRDSSVARAASGWSSAPGEPRPPQERWSARKSGCAGRKEHHRAAERNTLGSRSAGAARQRQEMSARGARSLWRRGGGGGAGGEGERRRGRRRGRRARSSGDGASRGGKGGDEATRAVHVHMSGGVGGDDGGRVWAAARAARAQRRRMRRPRWWRQRGRWRRERRRRRGKQPRGSQQRWRRRRMRWCDGRQSHACQRWPGENAGAHSYSMTRLAPCTTPRRRAAALAPRHATPSDTATTTSASSKHERNGGAEIFASRDDAGGRERHTRRVVAPSPAAAQTSAQRHRERSMFHAAPSRSAFIERLEHAPCAATRAHAGRNHVHIHASDTSPNWSTATSSGRCAVHRWRAQPPAHSAAGGRPRSGASARTQSRRHLLRHLRAVISYVIFSLYPPEILTIKSLENGLG